MSRLNLEGTAGTQSPEAAGGNPRPLPESPTILDIFCGAGGAGVGYSRAGFTVRGVDIDDQHNYPFPFVRADARDALHAVLDGELEVDAIHASPPCQAYSDLQKQNKREYPELIAEVRDLLKDTGLPYVIENVEGAPLIDPIVLCGTMFSKLRVIRHRLFETNWGLAQPKFHPQHPLVFTHDKRKAHYGTLDQNVSYVQVTGGGNCTVANKRDAMGVPWMTGKEANEAIPPAYTEWIGRQLLAYVQGEVLELAA